MKKYTASCDCGWAVEDNRRYRVDEKLANHRCKGHRRSCRTCGWSVTADSAKRADYAKRQHSCARHLARQAAEERAHQRAAAVDRAPKPCLHKEADHVHGTYACYVLDTCRCEPCSAANRDYEANRTRQQAYGRWNGLVDARPAREHCQRLMAQGMGLKRIAVVAGVSHGSLSKMMYGVYAPGPAGRNGNGVLIREPSRRIRPATAEMLLSVQLDLASGAKVDGTGTRRRLQALVAIGYSISDLGRRIGISNIHRTIHGRGDGLVMRSTAAATARLYDELSMHPGTNTRARRYAEIQHWPPPLAWDDEHLDDPGASPAPQLVSALAHDPQIDEAAIFRRLNGDRSVRLRKGEAAELVRRWVATGRSLNACERVTGVKPDRYFTIRDTTTSAAS